MDKNNIYDTNKAYWNDKGNDFLEAVTLPNLGAFVTDEKHNLFGDVTGKTMLEIGCGNGKSLIYNAERMRQNYGALIFQKISWQMPNRI